MIHHLLKTVYLFVSALIFLTCTLEKEPLIPTGVNNQENPIFQSVQVKAISSDTALAETKLANLGNLNILSYGWEWTEQASAPSYNDSIAFEVLKLDTFATLITRLTIGKTYLVRPFVRTGTNVKTYGPAQTVYMGIPKLGYITLLADSACLLRVQCGLQSPVPVNEYGILYLEGKGTPTLENNKENVPGSVGISGYFEAELTMLTPNTEYAIRGYAKTSYGTGYGPVQVIKTRPGVDINLGFSFNTDSEVFKDAIVTFSNSTTNANAFSWNFGDGSTSGASSPVHTFNQLGQMQVRLTAINSGCAVSKDTIIKVIPNPFEDYWVPVAGGTFIMGCTSEQGNDCGSEEYPAHQVTLTSFDIGKTEVTQGQWLAVTGFASRYFYDCGSDCPVEQVSWNMIRDEFIPKYFQKTGRVVRLPTEAEWEYAARGGNLSNGFKYTGSNNIDSVAWYNVNSDMKTWKVKRKKPNELGLYDMSGNVNEWCSDWYDINYYNNSPTSNPTGPSAGSNRVYRGGSWINGPQDCRVSYRGSSAPDNRYNDLSFRLARTP